MSTNWINRYTQWSKVVATHGANSEQSLNPTDPHLAVWLRRQRVLHKAGKLTQQEIEMLEREGMDWSHGMDKPARKPSKAMIEKVNTLLAEVANRSWVEIRESQDGFALLCSQIATARKKGKLTQDLIEALNAEAYIWDWQGYKKGLEFDKRIVELKEHKAIYGDANISRKLARKIGKSELFNWQVNIRTAARRGKVTQEQVMRLKDLGVFLCKGDGSFNALYDVLENWFEVNGDSNLPTSHPQYSMLAQVRREYKNDTLSPTKKAMLDKLAFDPDWRAGAASIQARVDRAIAFRVDNGSFDGLQHVDHVKTQIRQDYLAGRLTDDQIKALEQLGFEWRERKDRESVAEKAVRLLEFFTEHGHMYVPHDHDLGPSVNYLRSKYNRGEMPESDIAILNQINFPWDGRVGVAYRNAA